MKLITQVALFRFGVKRFEREVNSHLEEGFSLDKISIEKKGLRFLCWALLKKD